MVTRAAQVGGYLYTVYFLLCFPGENHLAPMSVNSMLVGWTDTGLLASLANKTAAVSQ